jgi:DNA-binding MarR family transcriptional regulator
MPHEDSSAARDAAAIGLLRRLRAFGDPMGIRHSGIAFDVAMMMFEENGTSRSVPEISQATGYTGPTIRLVLKRLTKAGSVVAENGPGRTRTYALTPEGRDGFRRYIAEVWAFADAAAMAGGARLNGAAGPAPARGRPSDPIPLPVRYAGVPPDREAAE